MDYGIQLYSVNEHMANDVAGTIEQVAKMGYTFVETAGFFGKTAQEFKAICDQAGVRICSAHTSHDRLLNGEDQIWLPYHKALNCPYFISPVGECSNKEELEKLISCINECAAICRQNGMEFMYHNHHTEFVPNTDGVIPHLQLQEHTDIRFQIDVYWVYRAGIDPMYILQQLGDRVGSIHLKDGTMERDTPLGQGNVDIPNIVKWGKEHKVLMVVENETAPERQMIEAKACIDYLKTLEA